MTKEFMAILEDMIKEYELLAKYNGGKDYLRWNVLRTCADEAKDHVSLKRLKEKMSHTLPQCGEDNSKERYRYIQWISDNNAIKEAADEEEK